MDCPRCATPLDQETFTEKEFSMAVEKCNSCGGHWFDSGELERIENIIEPTILDFRKIPTRKKQLQPLYCPECEGHPMMDKTDHSRDHHVIMDYCSRCNGIWLDGGELEAIQKENVLFTVSRFFKWLLMG
jgi:hypothetical protein